MASQFLKDKQTTIALYMAIRQVYEKLNAETD